MKKFLTSFLVIVLTFSLVGCGGPSPSETVTNYLTAVKAKDEATIASLYLGEIDDTEFTPNEDESFGDEVDSMLQEKMSQFEFTIGEETIDGDKATVEVTIKTYDLGSVALTALSEYASQVLALAFTDANEAAIEKVLVSIMKEKLQDASLTYEKTEFFNLTKTEEGWKIEAFKEDSAFIDAMTGGLITTISEVEDFSEYK